MTKERKFLKSYASRLMKIAISDLEAAKILFASGFTRKETILFQVEQSIEKGLKAFLVKKDLSVPLTHDLNLIIDRFPKGHAIPHTDQVEDLIQFATIRRYEDGEAILTNEEVQQAIRLAEAILDAVTKSN
jgi:HEPN domain-containing protein